MTCIYLVYFVTVAAVLSIYVHASDINVTEVVADVPGSSVSCWESRRVPSLRGACWAESIQHLTRRARNFAFEILWRGIIYGIVDALLLSAFPGLIAWELISETSPGPAGAAAMGCSRLFSSGSSRRRTAPGYRTSRTSPAFRAGDRQHHHLPPGDCVRQSCRVGPGARIHASGGVTHSFRAKTACHHRCLSARASRRMVDDRAVAKRWFIIAVPPLLITSMYGAFRYLTARFGFPTGYLAAFGVYWIGWCVIVPTGTDEGEADVLR